MTFCKSIQDLLSLKKKKNQNYRAHFKLNFCLAHLEFLWHPSSSSLQQWEWFRKLEIYNIWQLNPDPYETRSESATLQLLEIQGISEWEGEIFKNFTERVLLWKTAENLIGKVVPEISSPLPPAPARWLGGKRTQAVWARTKQLTTRRATFSGYLAAATQHFLKSD